MTGGMELPSRWLDGSITPGSRLRLPDPAAQEFLGPEFGLIPTLQNFVSIPTVYARKTRRGGSGKVQRFFRDVMGSEAVVPTNAFDLRPTVQRCGTPLQSCDPE